MNNTESIHNTRMLKFVQEVSIYPVSCEKLANGRSDFEWLTGVLAGGARIVQLRDKVSDDKTLFEKARFFRAKTKKAMLRRISSMP